MYKYQDSESVSRAGVYCIEEYTKSGESWFDIEVSVKTAPECVKAGSPEIDFELVAGRFGSWEQAAEWLYKAKGVALEGYFA